MGYNNNNATWNEPTLPEHVDALRARSKRGGAVGRR